MFIACINPVSMTLAYTKSPKTSRRTTFQDELQAAVSARASKTKTDQYSYSDDFEEDEDGKMASKICREDNFLNELLKSRKKRAGAFKAEKSKSKINDFEISDDESKPGRTKRVSFLKTQRISSPSGDTTASESHEKEPLEYSVSHNNDYNNSFSSQHSANVSEDNDRYKSSDVESADHQIKSLSCQTSGDSFLDMPLPLPSDNSVTETPEGKSSSPQTPQLPASDLKHVSSAGLFNRLFCLGHPFSIQDTLRSQSVCSRNVESKYLGSLKVLDRKVSLQESQPQAGDSLRAVIYQEWLRKKKEKSKENMKLKKTEETLKDKKKRDEEAKKGDAVASYEAWKEKKAESLKAKAKEEQDKMRKEQQAIEEKAEKKQSAKQVFEKWKQEHDRLLKEKYRKEREAEDKQKFKKQEKEEERQKDSKSAFTNWHEKKKDVLHEKVSTKRKEVLTKAEEERYMKEERDKMALEMYENWLIRKELEQKRRKEERRIQAILRDSPPPPWSPPNKTIPFRK
uniref:Microtubule-associated protein 9 n=1 Tax=Labrus bergylta TaxID=56723 RepID=A0A3Q3FXZ8_9LABR